MAPTQSQQQKRKHTDDDNGSKDSLKPDRIPQPPPPQSGHPVPINYLSKANATKLELIEGDTDTFSDVLTLINEYEGVLSRHESLASNLGAKLTAPRLLKAMEGVFEGAIVTTPYRGPPSTDPITWFDILEFAREQPADFVLMSSPAGMRSCQFLLRGVRVEISEDDWRLIVSGALDRFKLVPPEPVEEDETVELATLDIIEQRLQVLIKKADEVARRARQLNYQLSGRKAAISARRSTRQASPNSGTGFQAVNQPSCAPAPKPNYDLRADLVQQFTAPARTSSHGVAPASFLLPPEAAMATPSYRSRVLVQQPDLKHESNRLSPSYNVEAPATGAVASSASSLRLEAEEEKRNLVTARMTKIARGDAIYPPCDRCRRLRVTCTKHLTACQGCTKKHARCVWKGLTDDEVAWLRSDTGDGDEDGRSALSNSSAPGSQTDQGREDWGHGEDQMACATDKRRRNTSSSSEVGERKGCNSSSETSTHGNHLEPTGDVEMEIEARGGGRGD